MSTQRQDTVVSTILAVTTVTAVTGLIWYHQQQEKESKKDDGTNSDNSNGLEKSIYKSTNSWFSYLKRLKGRQSTRRVSFDPEFNFNDKTGKKPSSPSRPSSSSTPPPVMEINTSTNNGENEDEDSNERRILTHGTITIVHGSVTGTCAKLAQELKETLEKTIDTTERNIQFGTLEEWDWWDELLNNEEEEQQCQ